MPTIDEIITKAQSLEVSRLDVADKRSTASSSAAAALAARSHADADDAISRATAQKFAADAEDLKRMVDEFALGGLSISTPAPVPADPIPSGEQPVFATLVRNSIPHIPGS